MVQLSRCRHASLRREHMAARSRTPLSALTFRFQSKSPAFSREQRLDVTACGGWRAICFPWRRRFSGSCS